MKNFTFILFFVIAACSSIEKNELASNLIGNSYEWKINLGDTIITQELNFFSDSLFTIAFEDQGKKYAQFGRWRLTDTIQHSSLFLSNPIDESFFRINSWDGKTLKLSNGRYTYEAIKFPKQESSLSNEIFGSWVAPLDSFPRTIPEFEETGKFLMNPLFTFKSDSFSIRTEDFRKRGQFKIINGVTELVILESELYYDNNKIIIVENHTPDSLELRLKNRWGKWIRYRLERINGIQHALK